MIIYTNFLLNLGGVILVIKSLFDYKSTFDLICGIFEDRLSEDSIDGVIEYREEGSTIDFFVLVSEGIKTYFFYNKDKKEYVFRSLYAFYENLDSDETIESIGNLVGLSLEYLRDTESFEPSRLPVSHLDITGSFDVRDRDNHSYDVTIELKADPMTFHVAGMAHDLFDSWTSFQNFALAFKNQLICENIDLDPKVMTTERNMQRLAKQ